VVNNEYISRSRLRVDARKFAIARLLPKVYGEKLAIGGEDELPAIQIDPLEGARRLAFVLERAKHLLGAGVTPPVAEPLRLTHVELHGAPVHKSPPRLDGDSPDPTVSEAPPKILTAEEFARLRDDANHQFLEDVQERGSLAEQGLDASPGPSLYRASRPTLTGRR
jgi:hypothetical protein